MIDDERLPGRTLSRRRLLGAGAATLTTVTAGCDALSTDPADEGQREAQTAQGPEAPELARQVEQGQLPPVEDRLPEDPLVLEPVDRVGRYGGTWRMAVTGASRAPNLMDQTLGYENLVRWKSGTHDFSLEDIVPNIATEFEADPEGKEYTLSLRPGMKWSDGEPFTADDIVFAFEDVLLNKDLFPVTHRLVVSGEEPGTIEKIDDHTVRFRFAVPNAQFLQLLATPNGRLLTTYPAHYMKQFHITYDEAAADLAEKADLESWADLFFREAGGGFGVESSEKPVLFPWKPVQSLDESTETIVAERNPYYWKVDSDANQLPYIDQLRYDVVSDNELILLKASSGEIDMQQYLIDTPANKPVAALTRDEGNYDFVDTLTSEMNTAMIALNLTHKDEVLREIFAAKELRIGLSHAINREEIIDVIYQRQGEPWQGAPREESQHYNEQLAKQYTEYDLDEANRNLDQVVPDKDADGRRLRSDGEPIAFRIDVPLGGPKPEWPDLLELVSGYWGAVGIQMEVNTMDESLWAQRKTANDYDASLWHGDGGLDVELLYRWYAPIDAWGSMYGLPWARWYVNPDDETALEPPAPAKQQFDTIRQLQTVLDPDTRAEMVSEVLAIAQEQFWAIGITLNPPGFGIVKNNFHNVPDLVFASFNTQFVAGSNPAQFFIQTD